MERTWREKIEGTTDQILAQIKRLLDEGNIRRVVVKQQGRVVAEFPLTVGVVGTVLAPVAAAIGALTAVLADCSIEVEKTTPPAAAAPRPPPPKDRPRPRTCVRLCSADRQITGRGSRRLRDADHADHTDPYRHGTPIARISGYGVLLAPHGENLVHWVDLKLPVGPTRFT